MTTIEVPQDLAAAKSALNGIERLLTAKGWERAAIVYAFTTPSQGQRSDLGGKAPKLSFEAFAKLGVKGLTDRHVVAEYRAIWQRAIDDGHAAKVKPGDIVTLPTTKFPGRQDAAGLRRYVEQDPTAVARAMDRGKVDAETFAQEITPDVAAAIVGRLAEDRPGVIAEAVAQSPGAQRAVARNKTAREGVEDEGILVRGSRTPEEIREAYEDEKRGSRQRHHDTSRAFGVDEVVAYLRGAAGDLANAVMYREEFGVDDTDGEAEALDRVKRYLRVYEAKADFTDKDTEFLASIGLTLEEND